MTIYLILGAHDHIFNFVLKFTFLFLGAQSAPGIRPSRAHDHILNFVLEFIFLFLGAQSAPGIRPSRAHDHIFNFVLKFTFLFLGTQGAPGIRLYLSKENYSRTPLIRINSEDQPYGHAENPDN